MTSLNLSNSKGRDALVMANSTRSPLRVRWLDASGSQVSSVRVLKATVERDFSRLLAEFGGVDKVADALIHADPEIDLELTGSFLRDTTRAYVDPDKKVVHKIHQWEILRNPDGSEKQRRPRKVPVPNVTPDQPIRWSGKLLPKNEVFNKYVIVSKLQVVHVNGLTYDFLFEMARDLESKNSLLFVGAGPKANLPLILRRGATPYRGFLEGRTRGDEYCLMLHLSNMELKAPEARP